MHDKRNTIRILYVCEQFFFCLLISKKLLTGLVFYRRSLSLHMFPWNWFSDWLISCLTKDCKINFSNGNESLCELQKNQQKKVLLDLLDQVFRAEFSKAQPHMSCVDAHCRVTAGGILSASRGRCCIHRLQWWALHLPLECPSLSWCCLPCPHEWCRFLVQHI